MIILIDGVKYILKNPESENDLEKIIEKNHKYIFGDNSFYFNFKRKIKSKSGIGSIPDGYLIIFNNTPEWYILEVELASHPLYDHIIPQLTKFNRAIEEISTKKSLIDMFYDEIKTNLVLEANIKNKIGSGEIYKFISDLISTKPKIIIVINERTSELDEVTRDLRGDIKILEFKIFRREYISEEVDAYLFNPVIDFKNQEKPIIPKPEEDKRIKSKYDEDFYKKEFNKDSAIEFMKYTKEIESIVKEKEWPLEMKYNKHYCGFKAGFFLAFGIEWRGSKTFAFFFKLNEKQANSIPIKMTKYINQWKQAYYYIKPGETKTKDFLPLFELAYKRLTGD